jgi:hypothetical protein
VEIVFRQVNRTAVFRNEGMHVSVFSARIVELETRSAGQPDGGNGLVVECGGEFIESRDAASSHRNQGINRDVEDAGRLAQARLRSGEAYSTGIPQVAALGAKEKGGQKKLPALRCARQSRPDTAIRD